MTPAVDFIPLERGDALLLCTDGLTKHVTDARISEVLSSTDAEGGCRSLIDAGARRRRVRQRDCRRREGPARMTGGSGRPKCGTRCQARRPLDQGPAHPSVRERSPASATSRRRSDPERTTARGALCGRRWRSTARARGHATPWRRTCSASSSCCSGPRSSAPRGSVAWGRPFSHPRCPSCSRDYFLIGPPGKSRPPSPDDLIPLAVFLFASTAVAHAHEHGAAGATNGRGRRDTERRARARARATGDRAGAAARGIAGAVGGARAVDRRARGSHRRGRGGGAIHEGYAREHRAPVRGARRRMALPVHQ